MFFKKLNHSLETLKNYFSGYKQHLKIILQPFYLSYLWVWGTHFLIKKKHMKKKKKNKAEFKYTLKELKKYVRFFWNTEKQEHDKHIKLSSFFNQEVKPKT